MALVEHRSHGGEARSHEKVASNYIAHIEVFFNSNFRCSRTRIELEKINKNNTSRLR